MTPRTVLAAALVALAALIAAPTAGAAAWQGADAISAPRRPRLRAADDLARSRRRRGAIWWDDARAAASSLARRPVWRRLVGACAVAVGRTPRAVTSASTAPARHGDLRRPRGRRSQLRDLGGAALRHRRVRPCSDTPDADDNVPAGQLPVAMSVYSLAVNAAGDAVVAGRASPTRRRGSSSATATAAGGVIRVSASRPGPRRSTPRGRDQRRGRGGRRLPYEQQHAMGDRACARAPAAWGSTDVTATARSRPGPDSRWRSTPQARRSPPTPHRRLSRASWSPTALSPPTGGLAAVGRPRGRAASPRSRSNVDVAPSGAATAHLAAGQPGSARRVRRARGSTLTGTWGAGRDDQRRRLADARRAIGNDGSAVVGVAARRRRQHSGQARVRAADGTWGITTTIAPGALGRDDHRQLATDGRGRLRDRSRPATTRRRPSCSRSTTPRRRSSPRSRSPARRSPAPRSGSP